MRDDFFKKKSIKSLVAATEHIRDCARRRRVYCVAFDILLEAIRKNLPAIHVECPQALKVLEQCFPELHQCARWPKGI
jgi:hypothetical protein